MKESLSEQLEEAYRQAVWLPHKGRLCQHFSGILAARYVAPAAHSRRWAGPAAASWQWRGRPVPPPQHVASGGGLCSSS